MPELLLVIPGSFCVLATLWDVFEAVVLPRRVDRRIRFARYYYVSTWWGWRAVARRLFSGTRREAFLALFGPLSLLGLLAAWATILILGFGLVLYGTGSDLTGADGQASFMQTLYTSGVTFFTLGFGDFVPTDPAGQTLAVVEVGTGFGFLALVVSYLPVLYQAFSGREVSVTLLDARSGSPPTAAGLLQRWSVGGDVADLRLQLRDWELWSAELLERHLSFPPLAFYRSQHERESWLAALTVILDTTALIVAGGGTAMAHSAWLTFAIARHASVDLAQVEVGREPPSEVVRGSVPDLPLLHARLTEVGLFERDLAAFEARLAALRAAYEPYVMMLSNYLLMALPSWVPDDSQPDDWMTSPWQPSMGDLAGEIGE